MFSPLKKAILSTLTAKIIGGYLLILVLMNIVGWLAFLQFRVLSKEVEHLTQDVAKEVRISDQIVFQTLSVRSSVDSYLTFQKEEDDLQAEEHINEYLSAMSEIAFEYGGTIDIFVGDAIMIFFGAPEVTPNQDNAGDAYSWP